MLVKGKDSNMAAQKSFKSRVRDEIIANANMFKEYFVDYDYLICSEAFTKFSYYIITAHGDNYEHLTGVASDISAEEFFQKSLSGLLQETDFTFEKSGQTEIEVKGSVRRKINVLPNLPQLFASGALVEENFRKNHVECSFAAGETTYTLGFSSSFPAKPKSLMKGNQLDEKKAKPIELILRRGHGETLFDEIILGKIEALKKYASDILPFLSEKLLKIILKQGSTAAVTTK